MSNSGKLYLLLFKSGIKRDGTPFQGDYCTSGQWVRWYQGYLRTIGGMLGVNPNFEPNLANTSVVVPYLFCEPNDRDNDKKLQFYTIHWAASVLDRVRCITVRVNTMTLVSNDPIGVLGLDLQDQHSVEILPIITREGKRILFCFTENMINLFNVVDAKFYQVNPIYPNQALQPVTFTTDAGGLPEGSTAGGMYYFNPYLILFGTNGQVLFSSSSNPYDFSKLTNPDEGASLIEIGTDKVIAARAIRGGNYSPTLLFWTLSTVVQVNNIAVNTLASKLDLKVVPISLTCSILSSNCIAEYNGFFYWWGTDNFYIYNGIVDTIDNQINLNFALNKLDLARREQVFAVEMRRYKEVWWFAPDKQYNDIKNIGCTYVIIYNIMESSWYDIELHRNAGLFVTSEGEIYTIGKSIDRNDLRDYVFRHEIARDEIIDLGLVSQKTNKIQANWTSPIVSFASFGPDKSVEGINRQTMLERIEPDTVLLIDEEEPILNLQLEGQYYPNSVVSNISSKEFNIKTTDKWDARFQARQIRMKFETTSALQMGNWMMLLKIGDENK